LFGLIPSASGGSGGSGIGLEALPPATPMIEIAAHTVESD
jgi:hypothetical protein